MQPDPLLMELRMDGYRVWLKPPVADEVGKKKSDAKLVVEGDRELGGDLRARIRDQATRLKLLVFFEDPPQWYHELVRLAEDPRSPVSVKTVAAAVACYCGGTDRWREVIDDVVTILEVGDQRASTVP